MNLFKRIGLLFVLMFFTNEFVRTQSLKGYIKNTKGESIPYANIVLTHKDIGTSSDQQGYFELNIENNRSDTLKFSALGYETVLIPVNYLVKDLSPTVTMQETIYTLTPITIIPSKTAKKRYKFGFFDTRKPRGAYAGTIGGQTAVYMKNTIRQTGIIETIYIRFSESSQQYRDKVNVRVRIYAKTKDNYPGDDLFMENLIIEPRKGKNKIDVSKHNLYFPLEGVFVAVEYLDRKNRKHEDKRAVDPPLQCTFAASNEVLTYVSYRNRKWELEPTNWPHYTGYCNGLIGIDVRTE
ncbi:MAG: carboxypeptidase-like regulatory domain-containing protein [Cytophagaceae bacterium]|jgi:hypothetical protein|nr:carboxypeptidase-like regulatory domain-containing protein [Cytophagaceae bacterium]